MSDRSRLRGTARCATLLAALLALSVGPAIAQDARPLTLAASSPDGGHAVHIVMDAAPEGVRCAPARARIPAAEAIELRIVNEAKRPLWFVAPALFRRGEHIESRGFTLDLIKGGFLVAPESTVGVLMRTPVPGDYPYACFEPGSVPRPESSGFLVAVAGASKG